MNRKLDPAEIELLKVDPDWNQATLLNQEGLFFLKDILGPLKLTHRQVMEEVSVIAKKGNKPWSVMGIGHSWSHKIVAMPRFAGYYREKLAPINVDSND